LKQEGLHDVEHTIKHMEKAQNHYVWANFKNVGELRINRLTALEDCTDDIVKGSGRYVPAT